MFHLNWRCTRSFHTKIVPSWSFACRSETSTPTRTEKYSSMVWKISLLRGDRFAVVEVTLKMNGTLFARTFPNAPSRDLIIYGWCFCFTVLEQFLLFPWDRSPWKTVPFHPKGRKKEQFPRNDYSRWKFNFASKVEFTENSGLLCRGVPDRWCVLPVFFLNSSRTRKSTLDSNRNTLQ